MSKMSIRDYLNSSKAEFDEAGKSIKFSYWLFMWIPAIIVFILFVIGLCISIYYKSALFIGLSFAFFVISILVISILQSIIRIFVYHVERIDENSKEIIDYLKQNGNNLSYSKANGSTNVNVDEKVMMNKKGPLDKVIENSISIIEEMLYCKEIDDLKFNKAIDDLKSIGTYGDANNLVLYYEKKYNELIEENRRIMTEKYNNLIKAIEEEFTYKPLNKFKVDDYLKELSSINTIADAKEKYEYYLKMLDKYYDENFEYYYAEIDEKISSIKAIKDPTLLNNEINQLIKDMDSLKDNISRENQEKIEKCYDEIANIIRYFICNYFSTNDWTSILSSVKNKLKENPNLLDCIDLLKEDIEFLEIFKNYNFVSDIIKDLNDILVKIEEKLNDILEGKLVALTSVDDVYKVYEQYMEYHSKILEILEKHGLLRTLYFDALKDFQNLPLDSPDERINDSYNKLIFIASGISNINIAGFKEKKDYYLDFKVITKRLNKAVQSTSGLMTSIEFYNELEKLNNYSKDIDVEALKKQYRDMYNANH